MAKISDSTLEDRYSAIELQHHLFLRGHDLPLSLANRLALAGYIKTLSAAMARLNPFLRKGLSASEAALKVLAMESPDMQCVLNNSKVI